MLALRFYDQRDIRLEELPVPKPKEDEVLIQVTDAGISQTQINEFVEGPFIINKEPHPLTGKAAPLIPCQEYGGKIVEVGENVEKSFIGRQVAVLPLLSCGECEYCRANMQNLCDKMAYHGLLGADGGFCEYSAVDKSNIFFVEEKNLLTFIEPILVAIHAAQKIQQFQPLENKKVLVMGAGAVGVSVSAVFQDFFTAQVTITDILDVRLKRARQAGLNAVSKSQLEKDYEIVIDAAGMDTLVDQPAIIEGMSYLKNGAPLLNLGTYFHPISFIPSELLLQEHFLMESMAYNSKDIELLPEVIKALSTDFSYFLESISLKNIIEDGYFRAEVDKESFTRLVVKP